MKKEVIKLQEDKENELFDILEKSDEYSKIIQLTEKALQEQWHDVLYSGIINTVFSNYKKFFTRKKGVPVKIRKAEGDDIEIRTITDVKTQENDTLQGDRFILSEEMLKMDALILFINSILTKSMKSLGSYYHFKSEWDNFLRKISNISGQNMLDIIPTFKPLKFRLSNRDLKNKIKERIDKLIKGLDTTSKTRLTSQIIQGIKAGERKSEMIERISKIGKDIAKNRAKRIVMTETEAIAEFMRYETARLNGVRYKTWNTVRDERVCPLCGPLDGKVVGMDTEFGTSTPKQDFSGLFPPVHPMCRCWLSYDLESNLASNFVDAVFLASTVHDDIDELFEKAKKGQLSPLYETSEMDGDKIINPYAVWAGGESLVGPDKNVSNYFDEISKYPNYKERMKEILKTSKNVLLIDIEGFMIMSGVDQLLLEARREFTDEGFVQLIRQLGFTKRIPSKNIKNS
jgi:SPP1 gp7 family putative phage head morphogenesis protein